MVEQNALRRCRCRRAPTCWCRAGRSTKGKAADLADDPTVRDLFLGGKAGPMLGGNGDSSNKGTGDFT
jgi:branched-chain amino acid transport system ATP-binding protein/neutral amino acid transport system ATP-binding protein